jgi:hypothetical protein
MGPERWPTRQSSPRPKLGCVDEAQYPPLTSELREQLALIEPSHDGVLEYRPCKVTLDGGEEQDFVLFARAGDYFALWGVWPVNDSQKRLVAVERVISVRESSYRLPSALANALYEVGESGMGYFVFTVVLRDGRRLPSVTGGVVDFPALPSGVTTNDIGDVLPEIGRDQFRDRAAFPEESTANYFWCLYAD